MSEKIISESLFEQFCDSNGIPYQRIATSSIDGDKTPDYDVFLGGQKIVTEIKQFDPNQEELQHLQELKTKDWGSFEWYGDSASRVRKKISDAMSQIKARTEYKFPSLLVLYNNTRLSPHITDSFCILTAMYGREAVVVAFPKDREPFVADAKFGGKQKVGRDYNTSLSAIAVMDGSQDSLIRLDAYHNIYARISFDPNWLRTQTVRHYSLRELEGRRFQDWIEI